MAGYSPVFSKGSLFVTDQCGRFANIFLLTFCCCRVLEQSCQERVYEEAFD